MKDVCLQMVDVGCPRNPRDLKGNIGSIWRNGQGASSNFLFYDFGRLFVIVAALAPWNALATVVASLRHSCLLALGQAGGACQRYRRPISLFLTTFQHCCSLS